MGVRRTVTPIINTLTRVGPEMRPLRLLKILNDVAY